MSDDVIERWAEMGRDAEPLACTHCGGAGEDLDTDDLCTWCDGCGDLTRQGLDDNARPELVAVVRAARERDGHDELCAMMMEHSTRGCRCGHERLAAALAALERRLAEEMGDERCADCDGSGEVEIETRPTPRLGCDPPGPSWQVAPCPTCQPREHALWEDRR